jgi:hypothetical protein
MSSKQRKQSSKKLKTECAPQNKKIHESTTTMAQLGRIVVAASNFSNHRVVNGSPDQSLPGPGDHDRRFSDGGGALTFSKARGSQQEERKRRNFPGLVSVVGRRNNHHPLLPSPQDARTQSARSVALR